MIPSDTEKPYRPAVLKDRGGDLTKEWYIEFYACTTTKKEPQRKRVKIPLIYDTEKAKRKFAREEIAKINRLLAKGHVFVDKNFVETVEAIKPLQKEPLLFEAFYNQIKLLQHLRDKSTGTYESSVNMAKEFFVGDIPFKSLTRPVVYQLRDFFINTQKNAAATANKKIQHLAMLFKEIMKRNGLMESPFEEIDRLVQTQVSSSNIAFTKEDRATMENYLFENDPGLYAFTRYMYYAFIRPKELASITMRYVKKSELILTIPGEEAKNRKTRNIHVIRPLAPYLPRSSPLNFYLFGKGYVPNPYQLSKNNAYNRNLSALKACGLLGKD